MAEVIACVKPAGIFVDPSVYVTCITWMYTGLMAAGVPLSAITSWCDDPLVTCNGKKGSLFDHLEDLDADVVLLKAQTIV